jgi:hypothetical protein
MHDDPDSTQILTWHNSARSHTISQLTNSGTTLIRQVPVVQPLWVLETPEDRVGAHTAPPSNNLDGTGGFINRQR